MLITLKILIALCFIFLAYQDFKDKLFYTFLPFAILLFGTWALFLEHESDYAFFALKYNFIFLALLLLIGYLFAAIKYGDFSTVSQSVGMGDILILFALIPLFSPILFRIVFIASAVSGILLGVLYAKVKKQDDLKIPFAGLLSLICALLIITEFWTKLSLHEPSVEL